MRKNYFLIIWTIVLLLFLYIPILSMIIYSFNDGKLVSVWSGFSFRWYRSLFSETALLQSAWLSLKVAVWSSSIALIIGTISAYAVTRPNNFKGRLLLNFILLSPLVLPDIVIGLSLLLLFVSLSNSINWLDNGSIVVVTVTHAVFCSAYVMAIMQSKFYSQQKDLEDAARDLGAKPARIFYDVILPTLSPALLSSWLLSFTLSIDDVVVTSFVAGPGSTTLPIYTFAKIRFGLSPIINVMSTLIIVLVTFLVLTISFMLYKIERKRMIVGKNYQR